MADVITLPDLTSYPGVVLGEDGTNTLILQLVNGLVHDIIGDLDPVPTKAKTIALEAAARALRLAQTGGATSVTKTIADWSKTIRYEGSSSSQKTGVFLTEDEEADLRGLLDHGASRPRSIPMNVPGFGTGYGSQRY